MQQGHGPNEHRRREPLHPTLKIVLSASNTWETILTNQVKGKNRMNSRRIQPAYWDIPSEVANLTPHSRFFLFLCRLNLGRSAENLTNTELIPTILTQLCHYSHLQRSQTLKIIEARREDQHVLPLSLWSARWPAELGDEKGFTNFPSQASFTICLHKRYICAFFFQDVIYIQYQVSS